MSVDVMSLPPFNPFARELEASVAQTGGDTPSRFTVIDSKPSGNYETRLLRAIHQLLVMLTNSSIDKKTHSFHSKEQVMVHAKQQGKYIREEARWGVVIAAIAMAATGFSIIPQLDGMHIDRFMQAGQQIGEKLLGSNYQPKMLVESSSREVLIQELQQMNSDQAESNTRREVLDILNRMFQTREAASRSGG